MKYGFVIFDVDGTLVNSEKTGVVSLQMTLKELIGVELSYEEALPFFGISSTDVAARFNYPDRGELSRRWSGNFEKIAPEYLGLFPGVTELMKELKASGSLVGIVTSRNNDEINADSLVRSLVAQCDVVVSASDVTRRKPDPEPVLCAISKAQALRPGLMPSDCIYCGDTDYDCAAGQGAGCSFALADWMHRGLRGIPADFIYCSDEECRRILSLKASSSLRV